MNRVIILEDEAVAARRLKKMVSDLEMNVIKVFHSSSDLQDYLKFNKEPDLYLMDIHLSDRIVFEYLAEVSLSSPIIFTTAYDQYAIRAFKQNSIDYLMKPIERHELKSAIEKYKKTSTTHNPIDAESIKNILLQKKHKNRISIRVGDKYSIIEFDDVTHIYSEDKSTFIHQHSSNRSFPIEESLSSISEKLNPEHFFQINRGCTVNINFIRNVIRYSGTRLRIILQGFDKKKIIVAREKVSEFKDWMG